MPGSGAESYTSRSADRKLFPRGVKEEMIVCIALRRSREESARQRLDSLVEEENVGLGLSPDMDRAGTTRMVASKNLD